MQKNFFHNYRLNNINLETKKFYNSQDVRRKKIVNINKLLNRVKVDQQVEKKQKIVFLSLGVFLLCSVGTLLSI